MENWPQKVVLTRSLVQEILCKLIGATQSTCVFFSSFSILLIAMDRYLFIVRPMGCQISIKQVTTVIHVLKSGETLTAGF